MLVNFVLLEFEKQKMPPISQLDEIQQNDFLHLCDHRSTEESPHNTKNEF